MVGALLVAGSAVGVFAAHLRATAEPDTRYLVAARAIEPGTRFASRDDVLDAVTSDAIDLSEEVAARAVPLERADELVGRVVVAPLAYGDLLTRSAVVEDGAVPDTHTLSFSVARADAVAGSLRPGERIDVLATYGAGETAYTSFVARAVPLLRISGTDGSAVGDSREVTVTVAVRDPADVQALGHAVNTATVFLARSAARAGDPRPAPGAYRVAPREQGPRPEPAVPTDPVGTVEDTGGDTAGRELEPVPSLSRRPGRAEQR